MDNGVPRDTDLEKGIGREDTEQSETIPTPGGSSSPKSTSWSLRQLVRANSDASRGEGQTTRSWWLWSKSTTEKEPSQGDFPDDEFPDEEELEKCDTENIVRRLGDCPKGYPLLAAFLDSDDNFMMFRRFGYLQTRILLEKQEQLRRLEEELDFLDKTDHDAKPRALRTLEDGKKDNTGERRVLMRKIEKKFRDYATLVQAAQSLTHCNRPSSGEVNSVRNFINYRQPLVPSQQKFIKCKEDLITLRPGREHAWLDASVEKALKWMRCDLIEFIFCSKDSKQKAEGEEGVYYTRERIDAFVGTIIILAILALLVIPIYLLLHVTIGPETAHSNAVCIGILLVSALFFSASLAVFTRARRHEILGAAAAYCAVLVVFLGSNGHSGLIGPAGAR